MKIKGIDGMSADDIRHEVDRGGRFVFYLWVASGVFLSIKRPTSIYFIKSGRSPVVQGLPWVIFCLLLGWWGIPWGLIYTPHALWVNLRGGKDVTTDVLAGLN